MKFMRPTLIVHANPRTFAMLADNPKRFAGRRSGFFERAYAAWLVFSGRADALSWEFFERSEEQAKQQEKAG